MLAPVISSHAAHDSLGFRCRDVAVGYSCSVGEPHIYIGKVLHVRGEEGAPQSCADQDTSGQKNKRASDKHFAMFECVVAEFVVDAGDAVRAPILDWRQRFPGT